MWQVVGHPGVVDLFSRLVESSDVPQALLLTGPRSVGKSTLALELAKALNCVGDDPPCQRCLHCRQTESGSHPDVLVTESADGKDSIAIAQVRQLRDAASLRPFQGRRKVYIVTRAEELTAQAADALLKTLEEPQPEVVIILTANDEDAVPETVRSRCRLVPLRPIDPIILAGELERRGSSATDAVQLARLSRGSMGWALQAMKSPKLVTQREDVIERLSRFLDMSLSERLDLAESLAGDKKDRAALRYNLEVLALLGRDVLLLSQGLQPRFVSGDATERLRRQGERIGLAGVQREFTGLQLAMRRVDANVDPRLALEAMMLALP